MSNLIQELEAEQLRSDIPEFGPGDTVVVNVKVKEGDRERVQAFEGVVIAKRNRGINSSFTVRKQSYGEGVEYASCATTTACIGKSAAFLLGPKLYPIFSLHLRHGACVGDHATVTAGCPGGPVAFFLALYDRYPT